MSEKSSARLARVARIEETNLLQQTHDLAYQDSLENRPESAEEGAPDMRDLDLPLQRLRDFADQNPGDDADLHDGHLTVPWHQRTKEVQSSTGLNRTDYLGSQTVRSPTGKFARGEPLQRREAGQGNSGYPFNEQRQSSQVVSPVRVGQAPSPQVQAVASLGSNNGGIIGSMAKLNLNTNRSPLRSNQGGMTPGTWKAGSNAATGALIHHQVGSSYQTSRLYHQANLSASRPNGNPSMAAAQSQAHLRAFGETTHLGHITNLNDSFSTVNQSLTNIHQLVGGPPGAGPPQASSSSEMLLIHDLKREMRRKEQDFQKQNAILKQQVQLLELQAKEFEQREEKLKRMHESMLNAVQAGNNGGRSSLRGADGGPESSDESRQIREEYEEIQQTNMKKIKELEDKLKESQYQQKNLVLQIEEREIQQERKVQELQLDKRNLENKIKQVENQIAQADGDKQLRGKCKDQEDEIERLKERMASMTVAHKNAISGHKAQSQGLEEQKRCLQQQVSHLSGTLQQKESHALAQSSQIEQLDDSLRTYEHQVEEMESQILEMTCDIRSKDEAMQALSQQVQILQQSSVDSGLNIEFGGAQGCDPSSERSNMQMQRLADENEYLDAQLQSQQETVRNQQESIQKYQNIENLNHKELQQKDSQLSLQKQEHEEKMLKCQEQLDIQLDTGKEEAQREKAQLQDQIVTVKNQFEDQRGQFENQIAQKDQLLEKLQKQLLDLQGVVQDTWKSKDVQSSQENLQINHHSPIRFQNMSTLIASGEFQQTIQGMQNAHRNLKSSSNAPTLQQHAREISGGQERFLAHPNAGIHSGNQGFSTRDSQNISRSERNPQNQNMVRNDDSEVHHERMASRNSLRQSQTNNYTLNLNISNYPGSIMANHENNQHFTSVGSMVGNKGLLLHDTENIGNYQRALEEGQESQAIQALGQEVSKDGLANQMLAESRIGNVDDQQRRQSFPAEGHTSNGAAEDETLVEEEKIQIPLSEFDLLQSCQKIIDAASSMKCISCQNVFQTTDFYDHIIVRKECIIETECEEDQEMEDQEESPVQNQNYLDELKQDLQNRSSNGQGDHRFGNSQINDINSKNASHLPSLQNSGLNLENIGNMNDSEFYEALNMPLQIKDCATLAYQTQQTCQTQSSKIGADQEKDGPKLLNPDHENRRMSSPFNPNSQQNENHAGGLIASNTAMASKRGKRSGGGATQATQAKSQPGRAAPGQCSGPGTAGFGSRSGHTGMTGTVHSHILMSLSRSDSSSKSSEKSGRSNQKSDQQFENNVNENFNNDQDNIKNLAQNYGQAFTDQNLITEAACDANDDGNFNNLAETLNFGNLQRDSIEPNEEKVDNLVQRDGSLPLIAGNHCMQANEQSAGEVHPSHGNQDYQGNRKHAPEGSGHVQEANENLMSCSDDEADEAAGMAGSGDGMSGCGESYLDHQMDDLQRGSQPGRGKIQTRAAANAGDESGNYGQMLRLEEVESADEEESPCSKYDGEENVDLLVTSQNECQKSYNDLNSFNAYLTSDMNDPQNILSQSLRAIVNNNQEDEDHNMISLHHQDNSNTLQTFTNHHTTQNHITIENSANLTHPAIMTEENEDDHKDQSVVVHQQQNSGMPTGVEVANIYESDMVENLEKLYDLDTSRFEEEYSNLPSSKKKILLNQLGEEHQSESDLRSQLKHDDDLNTHTNLSSNHKPNIGDSSGIQIKNTSSQNISQNMDAKFVDISKFNYSMDLPQEQKQERAIKRMAGDDGGAALNNSKRKIKVVGLNLVPIINKAAKQPAMDETNEKQLIKNFNNKDSAIQTNEEAQLSVQSKPKFDLSRQITEMNEKKFQKESNGAPNVGKRLSARLPKYLKDAKAQNIESNKKSSRKQMKRPELNIDIEENNFEYPKDQQNQENKAEELNLNIPIKIEGLDRNLDGTAAGGGAGGGLTDLITQKNVMESFRNYQNKLMQQNQHMQNSQNIDINGQFQSVSSKNGTQNFDFGAIKGEFDAQGMPISSRKHAHATNRYNKNGFMMVTSQSSESESSLQNKQQNDNIEINGECQQFQSQQPNQQLKSKHSKNSPGIEQNNSSSLVEPQRLLDTNVKSPSMQKVLGNRLDQYEYDDKNYDNAKTIEQVKIRIMQQSSSQHANNMQGPEVGPGRVAPTVQVGQFTDRRMDTSVDINLGSEMNSPLSKRMMPSYQVKIMRNLKAGNENFQQINEEEKSETGTLEPNDSEQILQDIMSLAEEDQDEAQENMLDLEQANDQVSPEGVTGEGGAANGFESHRHLLGHQNHRAFVPTLMGNRKQKNPNDQKSDPQQRLVMDSSMKRDPTMLTDSEEQLIELRKQILQSQNSTYGLHHGGQLNFQMQGTQLTDQLLQNFERDQNSSTGAFATGYGGSNSLLGVQGGATSGTVALSKFPNLQQLVRNIDGSSSKQRHPPNNKNSDYIRKSMLLSSGTANRSGRKLKIQRNLISSGKSHRLAENVDNDQAEDCPSFFDEDEFDEDHPVPINHNITNMKPDQHLVPNETQDLSAARRDYQSTAPLYGLQLPQPNKQNNYNQQDVLNQLREIAHRNGLMTQNHQTTRKDPLKNSLFHNMASTNSSGLKTQNTQRYRQILSQKDKSIQDLRLQGKLQKSKSNQVLSLVGDGGDPRCLLQQNEMPHQATASTTALLSKQRQLAAHANAALADPYEIQVTADNINMINHLYRTNQSITSRTDLTNEALSKLESQYLHNSKSSAQMSTAGLATHPGQAPGDRPESRNRLMMSKGQSQVLGDQRLDLIEQEKLMQMKEKHDRAPGTGRAPGLAGIAQMASGQNSHVPSGPGSRSQSQLQVHMQQTNQLQRSKSKTKEQNMRQLTFNQSLGVINRPMMSNNNSTVNQSISQYNHNQSISHQYLQNMTQQFQPSNHGTTGSVGIGPAHGTIDAHHRKLNNKMKFLNESESDSPENQQNRF